MNSVKDCDEYGDNFFIDADEQNLKDSFDKIEKSTEVLELKFITINTYMCNNKAL